MGANASGGAIGGPLAFVVISSVLGGALTIGPRFVDHIRTEIDRRLVAVEQEQRKARESLDAFRNAGERFTATQGAALANAVASNAAELSGLRERVGIASAKLDALQQQVERQGARIHRMENVSR